MRHYTLQSDEVLLFESDVSIRENNAANHLILTNYYLVIVSTSKKMFKREEVSVVKYPVTDIKIYNEMPQVKQNNCDITVFFLSGELEFSCYSFTKATSFVNKVIELLTGKTVSTRGAEKVKGAIGLVDTALGINTMGTISGVLENGIGGTLLKGIGRKSKTAAKINSTSDTITSAANATTAVIQAVNATNNPEQLPASTAPQSYMTYEQQIEAVKKLKELLDMGIITQEEFDVKKKELLRL